MNLVYIAREDIRALGVTQGQFVSVEPGALEGECDVWVMTPLPRGRLGHVLGASLDGALELVASDPPVLRDTPEQILQLYADGQPVVPAFSLPLSNPWPAP